MSGLRIGLDLGGSKISGVVLAPDGAVVAARRLATPHGDYVGGLAAMTDLVARLERDAGQAHGLLPVGIGTPGNWLPGPGVMKNCNSTWLNGRPLLADLTRRLGARVRIANDADCFALSEATDGAGAGAPSVFGVILGTGVGGALVVGGQLLQGPNGLTGEWGHTPLPYFRQRPFGGARAGPAGSVGEPGRFRVESRLADRACYCGRVNCVETFLSGPGLARSHAELWSREASPETIALGEHESERLTLDLYQDMLSRSLAQVVNVVDPAVVVLGGGLSNLSSLYPALARRIPAYLFSSAARDETLSVRVVPARWGDDSGVRGAARLWAG